MSAEDFRLVKADGANEVYIISPDYANPPFHRPMKNVTSDFLRCVIQMFNGRITDLKDGETHYQVTVTQGTWVQAEIQREGGDGE